MKIHVDLFSGIGGFSLGLERAGFKTIVFCEQDKFCQKVLNKHWPEIPIEPDIKTFDGKKYAGAFILTGGFPCQPFSCAGKRRGKEDDRYLWPEMFRVIQEVRPTWIIGENVAGFIGMGLDDSISDLEREGYSVQAFIIPACAVNAPHRRDRVWIVAHSGQQREGRTQSGFSNGEQSSKASREWADTGHGFTDEDRITPKSEPEGLQGHIQQQTKQARTYCGCPEDSNVTDSTSNRWEWSGEGNEAQKGLQQGPESTGQLERGFERSYRHAPDTSNQGLQRGEWSGSHEQGQAAHGSITERNHAWDKPWLEVATRLCRVDARVSNRVDRLKSLGNAVVPQIPEILGRAIMEIEQ